MGQDVVSKELVVSRYNEDVSWVSRAYVDKVTIYNKGDLIDFDCRVLPNVGRESHTYLYHIINNYDNLADITIFCQGNPFDHCHDFLEKIAGSICDFVQFGCLVLAPTEIESISHTEMLWWLESEHIPKIGLTTFGGMFAVSKLAIVSRPRSFYKSLFRLHKQVGRMPWVMESLWPFVFAEFQQH